MYREQKDQTTTKLTGGALDAYPVGSIYMSMSATNPSSFFGGTWVRFAQGRMLIGVNELDGDFDWPGEIGGAKTHTLTEAEIPSHDHGAGTLDTTGGDHTHNIPRASNTGSHADRTAQGGASGATNPSTLGSGAHDHNITGRVGNTGGGGAHNNMPPYYAVYMFRRTA